MANPLNIEQFETLIQEGVQLLESLHTLLDSELFALESRDMQQIQALNNNKQELLLQFDRNNQHRAIWLKENGYDNNKTAINALLESTQQLNEQWHTLESALHNTAQANQRNEQVLTRHLQQVNQLLGLLRGQQPSNTLYTASGGKGDYSGQSRLGKA